MRERKGSLSVQNSIQTRLSFVMALVMVFVVCINFFIFEQIHTGVDRIDAVFSSNAAINDLSDTLNKLEGTVYEYLNIKGTKALENYYRYEQDYRELLDKLNDRNVDNEVKMLEKNIRRMSESYLNQTSETVQAKRGRNIEKYKASYEKELQLYKYINSYIYKLNNLRLQLPAPAFFYGCTVSAGVGGYFHCGSSRRGYYHSVCAIHDPAADPAFQYCS